MSGDRKRILIPFTGRKKRKARNKTREKYMLEKKRQYLAETDKGSYYNQEKWLEEVLDDKGAFYNGPKTAAGSVLSEKLLLKNPQILQENICVGVSFY